jgi:hypothetical protein
VFPAFKWYNITVIYPNVVKNPGKVHVGSFLGLKSAVLFFRRFHSFLKEIPAIFQEIRHFLRNVTLTLVADFYHRKIMRWVHVKIYRGVMGYQPA